MGKKPRKTRWRTLAIDGPQSDSEDASGGSTYHPSAPPCPGGRPYTNGTGRYPSTHSTPTKYGRHDPKSQRSSSTSTTDTKITFNEDEYTRITTPRQDVLFKKGYLNRPKTQNGTSQQQQQLPPLSSMGHHHHSHPHHHSHHHPHHHVSATTTGTSTGNSTGNGTPDHQSADGAEGTDLEYEQSPFVFPNGFMENGGIYFINSMPSFEPYPMVVYNTAPVCYPPYRVKRYSTDSMTESTSPNNENQDSQDGEFGGPNPEYNPVFNFVYPGYYYGNGLYQQHDAVPEDDRPADPRRPKKKRKLRRVSRSKTRNEGATDSCGEDHYSSEDEPPSPSECSTDQSEGVKPSASPPPMTNGRATPPESPPITKADGPEEKEEVVDGEEQHSEKVDEVADKAEEVETVVENPADATVAATVEASTETSTKPNIETTIETSIETNVATTAAPSVETPVETPAETTVPADPTPAPSESDPKIKYRVDAEEFVPRAYRQPSFENNLPITNFIPLPVISDIYPQNFPGHPFVPLNFIPHGYVQPGQFYVNQNDFYVRVNGDKEPKPKGIDIERIVSKLEEAAVERASEEAVAETKAAEKAPEENKASPAVEPVKTKTPAAAKEVPKSVTKRESRKEIRSVVEPRRPEPRPALRYADTLKKPSKYATPPPICPKLERAARVPEAPSVPVGLPPARKDPPADQWISVSRKKRRGKTTGETEDVFEEVAPEATVVEVVEEVPQVVEVPVVEAPVVVAPVVELPVEPKEATPEPVKPIEPQRKAKSKPKVTKKRVMIDDGALQGLMKPSVLVDNVALEVEAKPVPEYPLVNGQSKVVPEHPLVNGQSKPVLEQPLVNGQSKSILEPPLVDGKSEVILEQPLVNGQSKPISEQPLTNGQSKPLVNGQSKPISEQPLVNGQSKPLAEAPLVNGHSKPSARKPKVPKAKEEPKPKTQPKPKATKPTKPKSEEVVVKSKVEIVKVANESSQSESIKVVELPVEEVVTEKCEVKEDTKSECPQVVEPPATSPTPEAPQPDDKPPTTPKNPSPKQPKKNSSDSKEPEPVKPVSSPESTKHKKKKKKTKARAAPTEDGFDFLLDTSSDDAASKTNVEISQELNKAIQRGLYANLEQKLKTFNPSDSFFTGMNGEFGMDETATVEKALGVLKERIDLGDVLFDSALNKGTQNAMLSRLSADEITRPVFFEGSRSDPPDRSGRDVKLPSPPPAATEQTRPPQPYQITRAVKEWMDRTRETTPDVELLKSIDEIRNEFFAGSDSDSVVSDEAKNAMGSPRLARCVSAGVASEEEVQIKQQTDCRGPRAKSEGTDAFMALAKSAERVQKLRGRRCVSQAPESKTSKRSSRCVSQDLERIFDELAAKSRCSTSIDRETTRESTPALRQMYTASGVPYGDDAVSLTRDDSPDLLDCWDDSGISLEVSRRESSAERPVESAEDVLDSYESLYGTNRDFSKIQREVEGLRTVGGEGALPYRAICCSLM